MSERPQRADYVFNFILLKQTDTCDARRSRLQTRCSVFHGDTTQSEDWDLGLARFPQGGKAGRWRFDRASFSEDWSEDNEVGFPGLRTQHIGGRVAGGRNEKVAGGRLAGGELHNRTHFPRRQIVCPKMYSVASRGQHDIGAGVD